MKYYNIEENGIHLVFQETDEHIAKLLHCSLLPFSEDALNQRHGSHGFKPVEVQVTGLDRPEERHGMKYVGTAPGWRMQFEDLLDKRNHLGRKITLLLSDPPTGLSVSCHYQFFDGLKTILCWTEAENKGEKPLGLEYLSSFALTGVEKEGLLPYEEKLSLLLPHHGWQKEFQWQTYSFSQLGMAQTQPTDDLHSSSYISISNTGNWSTKEHLPIGILENKETGTSLGWQILQNGSWHWEICDQDGSLTLQLSGPTEAHSHWWKRLQPGETFTSVPAAVSLCQGDSQEIFREMTRFRRKIRRKNKDNENLPVIFNDYMNCLFADPTTEKELPLIEKAAQAGCEYYCIDAGWYSDGFWWDNVGQWLPAEKRFPDGLPALTKRIRDKGMIPGLWLEIEVMGIRCPLAETVSEDWFFRRHDEKVTDRSRYQLDFRNPEVVAHADEVIRRLVEDYGVGYIKMDYNIEPGIGTQWQSDSFGDGLLQHQRAYLTWLDSIFRKYPDLVIENCSSGGLRMDYALLSRHSIQSTSDQEDYRMYATIAANAPTGVTPEQAAVWSYPLMQGDWEETAFNMVSAMLLRIHQSGHLANLSEDRFQLVKEGIACYKSIRNQLKEGLPFWPLGLSKYKDTWVSLGMDCGKDQYIALWRRGAAEDTCQLPIPHLKGENLSAELLYPIAGEASCSWNPASGIFTASCPAPYSARLFRLHKD